MAALDRFHCILNYVQYNMLDLFQLIPCIVVLLVLVTIE